MIGKRYIKGKNDVIEFAKAKREDWGIWEKEWKN